MALRRWTIAWFALSAAMAGQVLQEAVSGSFRAYGEALNTLHEMFPALPIPRFQFDMWLVNVSGAALVLLALTLLVQRGLAVMRPASFALAAFATANAMAHILGLLPSDETWAAAVMPPLLLAASLFLFLSVPTTETSARTT